MAQSQSIPYEKAWVSKAVKMTGVNYLTHCFDVCSDNLSNDTKSMFASQLTLTANACLLV